MQGFKQRVPRRENVRHQTAEEVGGRRAREFFGRGTHHHRAGVLGEQQQSVFEARHHGIHVFTQGTENFMNAAQLLPDLLNFLAHLAKFIGGFPSRWSIVHADGDTLELPQDVADRCQRRAAYHRCENRGKHQRQQGDRAPALEARFDVVEQEGGRDSDAHFAKGISAQLERVVDIINARLLGEGSHLANERALHQLREGRATQRGFPYLRRVAGDENNAFLIHDGQFVEEWQVSSRLQLRCQSIADFKRMGHVIVDFLGIFGGRAQSLGLGVFQSTARGIESFARDFVSAFVRVVQNLL